VCSGSAVRSVAAGRSEGGEAETFLAFSAFFAGSSVLSPALSPARHKSTTQHSNRALRCIDWHAPEEKKRLKKTHKKTKTHPLP
jgi:hypothetical protein